MSWRLDDLPEGARQAIGEYLQRPDVQVKQALFDQAVRPLELADRAAAIIEEHQWKLIGGIGLVGLASIAYLLSR